MGHHIDKDGNFQSDKYPWLPKNQMIISFKDKAVINALGKNGMFSESFPRLPGSKLIIEFSDPSAQQFLASFSRGTEDRELGEDIQEVLRAKYGWTSERIRKA